MQHEPVDRVPVMCQLALGHYFLHSGRKPSEIWFDTPTFIETLADFQRRYGFDGFLINLPGRPANWRDYLQTAEPHDNGEYLVWRFGMETFVPADDNPHTFLVGHRDLPRADYITVDPDDPATFRLPGYVWNTWHAPILWDIPDDADLTRPDVYPDWLTRGLRQARVACPDVSVHIEVFSPFTHLLELFGYQSALIALIEAEEACHRMLDQFARQVSAQVECFASCLPDAVLISSAFAGGGFISREMYVDFVVPYERRVVEAIHKHALPAYVHTCGKIGDRLDLMAETGVDGIDTLDPPPLGTVDLAKAKAEFGKRFFFKGNLDAVNEMLRADDATFENAVRQRLAVGSRGSGYILSSACSVAPAVRPERLKRMVELSQECA
ncbi:MAG TPA: uroporphyrinogen decarboxylase family protein [Phycisphaerae bacterium]|nr:uroporphyrinogen decarboxylase family protein [Phycisphaerae bacterium]HRR87253.1 uroporphyrinogen decarboxylase family protein [Phycisphaerae bacterium]